MISLRATDGTDPHLRAIQHHGQRCRQKNKDTFFKTLQEEAETKHRALKSKAREAEDSFDEISNLAADFDGAELILEDQVRSASERVSTLSREQPELGVYEKLFPKGIGGVIDPERKRQIEPAQQLLDRMEEFLSHPPVQESYEKIKAALDGMVTALQAKELEERRYKKLFGEEQRLRTAIREQLIDAQARLTQRFKSNTELVERFFINDPRTGSTALYRAELSGRLGAKSEVLLSYLERQKLQPTPEQREKIESVSEEAAIDRWLSRAFDGVSAIDEILAAPPEEQAA